MVEITVFTPIYNRAYIVEKLFKSLEAQTCKDFEWLIVDDGSTDNIRELVAEWSKKATFEIRYVYKQNAGKHVAINVGVKQARGEWFFIVDSDDYLVDDAIETVLHYCKTIEHNVEFAGVVGLRANSRMEILRDYNQTYQREDSDVFSIEYIDANSIEYRYKFKLWGDRAEVVRTKIIERYPFPQFDNEKFFSEGYLWFSLAKDGYKFRWFNKIIYITEYLEDGLTRGSVDLRLKNPIGASYIANFFKSIKGIPLREKIRNSYKYYKFGRIAKIDLRTLIKQDSAKIIMPIGILLSILKK